MNKVLLVDDEAQILRFLGPTLRAAGYEVALAETGAEALSALEREPIAAVVLDLGLPDVDGKELIDRIRGNVVASDRPRLRVIPGFGLFCTPAV